MKKIFNIIICFLLVFGVGFLEVNAATLAIGDDTTSAGEKDKSVTVELKDDDLKDFVKVEFELSISGSDYASLLEFTRKPTSMTYTKIGEFAYRFEIPVLESSESGTLYATTIGSISYQTEENLNTGFKITPANVKFYKADGTIMRPGDSGIKIDEGTVKYEKPKSNDATLTTLVVSQGELSPEFDSNIFEYKVNVPDTINTIKITANTSEGASKTGTGNKTLSMGENKFEVLVTAEDGETKNTYTIIINRGEINEPSAYLKSLKINNIGCVLSPEFDKLNNKYTVSASSDIKSLDLKYELEDKDATISITGNEEFIIGENMITMTIKSSDGKEEQVYEITVNVNEEEQSTSEVPKKEEDEHKDNDNNQIWIFVIIGVVILGIVVGIAFILFRKKNTRTKNKKNTKEERSLKEFTEASKELFDDEKTTTYDKRLFNSDNTDNNSDDLEKTKEFNFKDFE